MRITLEMTIRYQGEVSGEMVLSVSGSFRPNSKIGRRPELHELLVRHSA
jgi:hypothetical protein